MNSHHVNKRIKLTAKTPDDFASFKHEMALASYKLLDAIEDHITKTPYHRGAVLGALLLATHSYLSMMIELVGSGSMPGPIADVRTAIKNALKELIDGAKKNLEKAVSTDEA